MSPLYRYCLQAGCGRITEGSMCPEHARAQRNQRQADRRLFAAMCAQATECAVCGGQATEDDPFAVDHVVPLSAGGETVRSNLRVVHRSCNSRANFK